MALQTRDRTRESTGDVGTGRPWRVILYDDDWHTFEEVVRQVQKATDCSQAEALALTYRAHTAGRAVVFTGNKAECRRVAGVLREIRLQVEMDDA